MKKVLFSTLMLLCSTFNMPLWSAVAETIEHPAITEILAELPHCGTLTQRERDGYIYLKVSDEYLDKLFVVLEEIYGEGLTKGSSPVGAHVSVILPAIGEPVLWNIPELGNTVEFTPMRLATVIPDLDTTWERVWILEVDAPELENLRLAYGLSPKVGNTDNEFHITIATKLREDVVFN